MTGPEEFLVSKFSATGCLPPDDSDRCSHPIERMHSEIVKYARRDNVADTILPVLVEFVDRALASHSRAQAPQTSGQSMIPW